jgi:hypothetical protein
VDVFLEILLHTLDTGGDAVADLAGKFVNEFRI